MNIYASDDITIKLYSGTIVLSDPQDRLRFKKTITPNATIIFPDLGFLSTVLNNTIKNGNPDMFAAGNLLRFLNHYSNCSAPPPVTNDDDDDDDDD